MPRSRLVYRAQTAGDSPAAARVRRRSRQHTPAAVVPPRPEVSKGHGTGSAGPGPSFGGDTKPSKILAVVEVPPSCVEIRALWAESDAKSFDASREP